MSWINVLDKDQLSIRVDEKNKEVIIETNSEGPIPKYVTLYLNQFEFEELLETLLKIKSDFFK